MCKVINTRRIEFSNYSSALVDLRHDLKYAQENKCIYNVDFSLYFPFFWAPRGAKNFSDQVRLYLFKSWVSQKEKTGMEFVFSRSTVLEMLHSVVQEIEKAESYRQNPQLREDFRKRVGKVTAQISTLTRDELSTTDVEQTFDARTLSSAQEYASELEACYALLPNKEAYGNINLTIDLMKNGVITSFYDHYGYENIADRRREINSLTAEIETRFRQRPSLERDAATRALTKHVDCRNIATSIIMNSVDPETEVSFVCAPYQVSHDGYKEVKRSHFVPAFWLQLLGEFGDFDAAKIMVDRILAESLSCEKLLSLYNDKDSIPDSVVRRLAEFLYSHIDPMKTSRHNPVISIEKMRDRLENDNATDQSFLQAIESAEEEFAARARNLVYALEIDEDLLLDTGLEDNPRAKEILSKLGL